MAITKEIEIKGRKLIIDNYPINSIKDLKSPWDKKFIKIGDKLVSLNYIEHDVLRKMKEPRIHFAIVCASYSCPKLLNKAYESSILEEQYRIRVVENHSWMQR